MTSINLISPIDKADDFSVRFRDPITIGKNSKIYLNYAHLSRLNEVRFKTDQTITLSDLNFIPRSISLVPMLVYSEWPQLDAHRSIPSG